MTATDEMQSNVHHQAGIGPGERLQAARIQQGLSLEEVASRMHLSADILEALEENNFEVITAPIFVKGYLRAYARIVTLDEDELIQQYLDYYPEEDPPITSTSNMAPELSVADARIKWTTYLVILVLGVLLAAWWWNKERSQEAPISLDAQPGTQQQALEEEAVTAGSEIEAASETVITSPEPVNLTDQGEMGESEPVTQQEPVPAPEPEPETPVEPEAPATAEIRAAAPTIDATGADVRLAPAGDDQVRIIVHADTWADVKDGSGYQLAYDLLRTGQTLLMTGQAPFAVFLGNGHGVELELNDQPIDITSRIRNDNTARLKIGE